MKRAKPSFDVARAELGGRDVRWVYRSDAGSPAAAPSVERAATPSVERAATPSVEGAAAPPVGRAATPPVERAAIHARPPSQPARSAAKWLETGVSVMMAPMTLTIMAMVAPMFWILGSRPRR